MLVLSAVYNLICFAMQNDRTPLFWASFRGHTDIVAMLLKFDADFSVCSMVSISYYVHNNVYFLPVNTDTWWYKYSATHCVTRVMYR